MFEPLSDLPAGVIGFEAVGEVTPDDFKDVFVPAIDEASKAGKIRLVFVLGGATPASRPAWSGRRRRCAPSTSAAWERCALVTDIEWIEHVVGLLHWLMPGTLKLFHRRVAAAKTWAAG